MDEEKLALALESINKRLTDLEKKEPAPALTESSTQSSLEDRVKALEEDMGKVLRIAEEAVIEEATSLSEDEQKQRALDITKVVLEKVEDDSAVQLITDAGKGHLLRNALEVEEEVIPADVEVRDGKVEEEGWEYLPGLDKSYKKP